MKHPKYAHSFEVVSELPEPLAPLARLAYNFRWTWNHDCRDLFRGVDVELWRAVEHNPVALLNSLSKGKLKELAADEGFLTQVRASEQDLDEYLAAETWFDRTYPDKRDSTQIAYFAPSSAFPSLFRSTRAAWAFWRETT